MGTVVTKVIMRLSGKRKVHATQAARTNSPRPLTRTDSDTSKMSLKSFAYGDKVVYSPNKSDKFHVKILGVGKGKKTGRTVYKVKGICPQFQVNKWVSSRYL